VVGRRQLLQLGFGAGAIDHRLRRGHLLSIHRGVYVIGGASLTARGRWLAAVLACGFGALISHRSAASLWDLLPVAGGVIDVTAGGRSRPGIRVHTTRNLEPEQRAVHGSIPVTSVARTIADLAASLDRSRLERLIERSEQLRLFDRGALLRACRCGRAGTRLLSSVLEEYRDPQVTRSELEREFFDLCVASGLPAPGMNATVAGLEVDALWAEQRLVVELDGYAFHSSRGAFERDRNRDARLQIAGYRVLRLTATRVRRKPEAIVDDITRLLELAGRQGQTVRARTNTR